jgi:hypothetical protein
MTSVHPVSEADNITAICEPISILFSRKLCFLPQISLFLYIIQKKNNKLFNEKTDKN